MILFDLLWHLFLWWLLLLIWVCEHYCRLGEYHLNFVFVSCVLFVGCLLLVGLFVVNSVDLDDSLVVCLIALRAVVVFDWLLVCLWVLPGFGVNALFGVCLGWWVLRFRFALHDGSVLAAFAFVLRCLVYVCGCYCG